MTNAKKKRRRPSAAMSSGGTRTTARGGANELRRERKEQARHARELERKRAARRASFRRAATILGVGVVAFAISWWFNRADAARPIPEAAIRAAEAAGCTVIETPADSAPGNQHLSAGQAHDYPDAPATSGPHDPSPLPSEPKVHTEPITETNAVHNLEHAGGIVYYLPEGDGGLPQDVVDRLETVVIASTNVLMAPYPELTEDRALALTAWNKLQTCPAGVTAGQAETIANGFIEAYVCTRNAPEPDASGEC